MTTVDSETELKQLVSIRSLLCHDVQSGRKGEPTLLKRCKALLAVTVMSATAGCCGGVAVAANIPLSPVDGQQVGGVFDLHPGKDAVFLPESAVSPGARNERSASIECLARAIGYEAANEPELGRQAVAQVVMNRVHHRAFPKTVCGVVFQGALRGTGCQFSFTCDGSQRRALSRRTWAAAVLIAGQAIDGLLPPSVGAATHYHADYVAPRWAPAMVRVGQIGAHIFYHFPGPAGGRDARPDPPTGVSADAIGKSLPYSFSPWGLASKGNGGTN